MGILATMLALIVAGALPAQTQRLRSPSASAADRLGLSCAHILAVPSTEWVAKFQKERGSTPQETIRAIDVYGQCYDERTERLVELLARKHAGPSREALEDFTGFEGAVKAFTSIAIADAQTPPDATRIAYARLYEKQFRYEFYREYEQKNLHPPLTPDEGLQFTKAKNRFGELIGVLPDTTAHQVHAAFGEAVGLHAISMTMKFALYRYAIFILEPPPEKPFTPPPF